MPNALGVMLRAAGIKPQNAEFMFHAFGSMIHA